jgi:hypothetical protein
MLDKRKCARAHCQGRMDGLAKHAKYCSKSCKTMDCRKRNAPPSQPIDPRPIAFLRCFNNCGKFLRGKQRLWCSDACRKEHERDYS